MAIENNHEEDEETLEYRQEAIENTLNGGQKSHALNIVQIRDYIFIVPITLIMLAFGIWSIFGSVHTWVDGKGVMMPSENNLHVATLIEGSGELENYTISTGDTVKKDQIIARLENKTLEEHAKSSQKYLDDLLTIYNNLYKQSKEEQVINQEKLNRHTELHHASIKKNEEFVFYLEKILTQIKPLAQKNLVPATRIENLIDSIKQTHERINTSRNQIIDEEVHAREYAEKWDVRLKDMELRIEAQKHENNKIHQQIKSINSIAAPIDGKIISILKTQGDYVNKGDPIAMIAKVDEALEGIVFVPPEEGKKIAVGQKALIIPTIYKREEFGGIEGIVTSVSPVPTNKNRLMAILQNEDLAKSFMPNNSAPFEVRVKLTPCAECYSKYKWTSAKGPNISVSPGVLTNSRILVRSQSPLSLIIPTLKKAVED